jgi:protein Mpv17
MFRLWIKSYQKLLETRPILTKTASASALLFAGDLVQQSRETGPWDLSRACRMGAWGFIAGPVLHLWFLRLETLIPPHPAARSAVLKMLVDQAVMAPPAFMTFVAFQGVLEGKSFNQITDKVKQDFWPVLSLNYMIWPAVQTFNFFVVPQNQRVGFVFV